jgi:hypothetical protein
MTERGLQMACFSAALLTCLEARCAALLKAHNFRSALSHFHGGAHD